jgi:Importin-beta N-terminal domain
VDLTDIFHIIADLFQVRQLAAVELRKRVIALWIQLSVEEREQIKAKLPEVILAEQQCVFPLLVLFPLFSQVSFSF